MIYKFKSKAGSDVIMMGPNGDQLLRLIGREPAAKGIVEVADMPAAIAALRAAVEREEADRRAAADAAGEEDDEATGRTGGREGAVSLRQRVWPLVDLLERSERAGVDLVWGV